MTRNDALSRIDQTILCLESCVETFVSSNDPILAECCEDSLRALKPLRQVIFNALDENKPLAHFSKTEGTAKIVPYKEVIDGQVKSMSQFLSKVERTGRE